MPPTSNPNLALTDLLASLANLAATDLLKDIRAELARGTLEVVEAPRGKKEEARRPYMPEEAYLLAVDMILAALDPVMMLHDTRALLLKIAQQPIAVVWRADYVEGTDEEDGAIDLPDQLAPLPDAAVNSLHKFAVAAAEAAASLSKRS